MTLWSLPVFVPLMLRRYRPEPAAWLFVALTITHLVFGPAITYFDFYALIMVYSVILYGNPRHSWRFIVTAFVMGLVAATVWSVSFNVGPLFAGPSSGSRTIRDGWLADAITMPTCPAVTGVVGASGAVNCGAKMLADFGMEAALIESSVLSVIIMALWQRARNATLAAMRERNASIVAKEAEETRIAALAERARIARDMHDVVAHTLSTIIVQSDGGRYAGAHDLAIAKHTMGTIRHEAERAQHDMQRLFNVFGASGSTGYADIDSLFDGHLVVSRHMTGKAQPDRLSADAETAVFRLVQEALTNTRKHAGEGAKATIDEIWSNDVLSITVSDNGRGAASAADGHKPGYGLVGMHERIESLGGSVQAGPGPNGGFIVAATIPLSPAAPQSGTDTEDPVLTVISRIRGLMDRARPKVLDQGDTRESNWVGRFAQWTERHYLLMDVIATIVLIALFDSATYGDLQMIGNAPYSPNRVPTITLTIIMLSPLAFRRRFPEGSALVMAILSAVQAAVSAIHPDRQHVRIGVRACRRAVWPRTCVALGQRGTGCGFVAGRHQDNVRLERLWDADSDAAALQRRIGDVPLAAGAFRSDAGWRGDAVWLCLHCDGPVEPFTRFERAGAHATRGSAQGRAGSAEGAGRQSGAQSHRHGHAGRGIEYVGIGDHASR